jgi:hypothetical protein
MLSGTSFFLEDLNLGHQLHAINRRTFLSLGLSVPFLARSGSDQDHQSPISMSRCLLLTDGCDFTRRVVAEDKSPFLHESRSWHCEIVTGEFPMKDWWLLVVQQQNAEAMLKVLQPSSAIPANAQFLAARITFRLHALQRRGFDVKSSNKRQLVGVVNQLICKAMKNMPA